MLRYVLEPGSAQTLAPERRGGAPQLRPEEVLDKLGATTVGADQEVYTPFGARRLVYVDYTASGRASTLVEDFVRDKVLPHYGNTHTLTTATARQTTYMRAEAREVIRHHLNASHEDAVIFAGNGSTGAAHLLMQTLERADFDVLASAATAESEARRDMHYREDRWGSGECALCGVRLKNASVYQAHRYSEGHRARLRAAEEGGTGGASDGAPPRRSRRVVIILDPLLHHSSSLPFRELLPRRPLRGSPALGGFSGSSCRQVEERVDGRGLLPDPAGVEVELSGVPVDPATGLMSEPQLQARLEALGRWRGEGGPERELVAICVLAAASNVTGLCADVPRVTGLARGSLPGVVVCWDFAAAAGHQPCDLNPPGKEACAVDAAFFSPHKLWGGPGSVGVLAVKKRLLCNAVPAVPGGGVVFFVSDKGHSYIQNSEEREEAGTPNILGCIRAGLAYHLLDQVPAEAVRTREEDLLRRVLEAWEGTPSIEVLGPRGQPGSGRTGVVSFMIRYGNASPGLYLHYQFVAALLNDLFGLQARGGCACAGPYGQWLLGADGELSAEFERCLALTAQEVLRPGFVRVGVHWAMSEVDLEVLIAGVKWVADRGWRMLAAYTFDRETGEWLHRHDVPERRRLWLSSLRVGEARPAGPIAELEESLQIGASAPSSAPRGAAELVAAADRALKEAYSSANVALSSSKWPSLDPAFAHLLWFATPADVAFTLRSGEPGRPQLAPGEGVFSADGARPVHSALDAARGVRGALAAAQVEEALGAPEAAASAAPEAQRLPVGDGDGLLLPAAESDDGEAQEGRTAPLFAPRALKPKIPKPLRGLVGKAIADYSMIKEGDRVLVGLSGGKDSLTVLHVLLGLQKSAPVRFDVAAANVNPETPEYNPGPLTAYLEAIGVPYHRLEKPIIEMAKVHMDPKRPSICAFCSRMKRGMLYSCMREHGYNVLVLGQHLDDFAESFLMSAIHNGLLRTMKANYWVTQEDVRVCRPLLYVRESMTAAFAKENQLPVIADNCPACFSAPKERHKTKLLLSSLEFDYPQLFSTLLRTMQPLYALETADRSDRLRSAAAPEDEDGAPLGREPAGGNSAVIAGGVARRAARAAARRVDQSEEDLGAEYALTACGAAEGLCCEPAGAAGVAAGAPAEAAACWQNGQPRPGAAPAAAAGFAAGLGLGATCAALVAWRLRSAYVLR